MRETDVLSLDGKTLRLFLAVFDLESVTRAAEHLGISQSAVSHSLDKLRRCLNDPLFTKSGRGIIPTYLATQIAPRARSVVAGLEGLAIESQYDPRLDPSPITIASNLTELLPVLNRLRQAVWRTSPDSRIRFIDLGSREHILPYLSQGTVDLIFSVRVEKVPPGICAQPFAEDRHVCFFDKTLGTGPKTVAQYNEAKHATLDFGGQGKSIVEMAANSMGIARDIRLSASNSFVLARMMADTNLVATLPKKLVNTAFSEFSYLEPPFTIPIIQTTMLWHQRNTDSGKRKWLSDLADKVVEGSFEPGD
ncbi:MAG: LysR family transcriptional regulator [Tateyamaria sp.]|uniref:LysR family transcriptional regulator n=1 Tax=Alphaproteobacteria TaxID=28211 RepID=UPI003271141B